VLQLQKSSLKKLLYSLAGKLRICYRESSAFNSGKQNRDLPSEAGQVLAKDGEG